MRRSESKKQTLHQGLLLGLDTVQQRRVGELEEVIIGRGELIVSLGLGDVLDESLEVTGISLNLESVQVKNVGSDVVEESRIVGNDDGGASDEGLEVVF